MINTTKINRIDKAFQEKKERLLSIYYTAGFPQLEDTVSIATALESAGADIIEIGMPFSDPVADGPTIQGSNKIALDNGMSIKKLFEQLKGIRDSVQLPIILMGYINPVVQYGVENFCKACQEIGIDGLILPDLPMQEYMEEYKTLFESYGLYNIFLITPQTSTARIREIDDNSKGFIYMVSSTSTTGAKTGISMEQETYFNRIKELDLNNPTLIGFGISNNTTFERACAYASGAIIGSAFIQVLSQKEPLEEGITTYIRSVKGNG